LWEASVSPTPRVTTEFSSALSIKLRARQLEAIQRANRLAMFTWLSANSVIVLPIPGLQFRTAARFADQYALGLRAGDARHLAICAVHGATLCTLDYRLSEAGPGWASRRCCCKDWRASLPFWNCNRHIARVAQVPPLLLGQDRQQ
jgi:predicted nucleic acid-binding protein